MLAVVMATICSLPVGPLVHLLNYLSTTDISKLDIALCNKLDRQQFLNCFEQTSAPVFLEDDGPARGDLFVSWMSFRKVSIKFFTSKSRCFTDASISKIIENRDCWANLQSLDLKLCSLSLESYRNIIRCTPNLLNLVLNDVRDETVLQVAASCLSLQSLSIADGGVLTDISIQKLFECCTQLISFSLHNGLEISDLTTPNSKNFPLGLQKVDLHTCYYMSGYTIQKIIENCRELTSLDISDIGCDEDELGDNEMTDALVIRIADCCSGLLSLSLAGLELITDHSIFQIAANCTQLQSLDLSELEAITDNAISKIVECCHQLETLYLPGCHQITDDAFADINEDSFPKLRNLTLNSSLISDDAISTISEYCPKIINLNLMGCSCITDMGMIKVAECCRDLEELDLTFCKLVADKSLERIGECCKKLKSLTINECRKINSIGIKFLAMKCLMLEKLDVGYIQSVDFSTVESVINSCQSLQIVDVYCCLNLSKEDVIQLKEIFHDRNVVIDDIGGSICRRRFEEGESM